jgi:2-polyprenyl-3-methyl-5-hydroxy-6-metoxy-1,4-benzoquinol methylase
LHKTDAKEANVTESTQNPLKIEYRFDNDWLQARERLAVIEAGSDPGTIRHLEALGVREGWHCLEVGGGGGSITEWLCRRVGSSGRVVATDVNPRFLEALDLPNLEVRRHNIVEDELEPGAFDLVHTRAVLVHLAERDKALDHLVTALKPGGWLLLEETDSVSYVADPRAGEVACERFLKVMRAHQAAGTGVDLFYGRRLYADVCAHGLVDVGAEGRSRMVRGATQGARFWQLSYTQLREALLGSGQLDAKDLDACLALFDDPNFVFMGPTVVATWGRRPL